VAFEGTLGGDLLSGTESFGEADFAVTDQLVACAVRDHHVDPRRIFVTGCSAGGLFSGAMAARRSSYVAAAAINTGGWTVDVTWQNAHTPALMAAYPAHSVMLIDFALTSKKAADAFKGRGGFVLACPHNGSHCVKDLGPSVWRFFEAHPFGVTPQPWSSVPSGFFSGCKIY
jgi:dienelactone hydrolase